MSASTSRAQELTALIGLSGDHGRVVESLDEYAHGMRPELDPDDEHAFFDWVTVNEIGLEYGFVDEAYLRAWEPNLRRGGALILSQVYFYGETETTEPFPYALPFGLELEDDRGAVRRKLAQYEDRRRSGNRDLWALPEFNLVVAYSDEPGGCVDSVLCYLPLSPWPLSPGADSVCAQWQPDDFVALFGRRWLSNDLRARFAPFGYEQELPVIRSQRAANFHRGHGLELHFAPGIELKSGDPKHPCSLAFAGVTFYASRNLDALQWGGELPYGLSFNDTLADAQRKVSQLPSSHTEETFGGSLVWHLEAYTLVVTYSDVECRVMRVGVMDSGLWVSFSDDHED